MTDQMKNALPMIVCKWIVVFVFHSMDDILFLLRAAALLDHEMNDGSNGTHNKAMSIQWMPPSASKNVPLFESPVDGFMSRTGNRFHVLIVIVLAIRSHEELMAIAVTPISQNHFTFFNLVNDPVSGDA